jgi:hypothetical protein
MDGSSKGCTNGGRKGTTRGKRQSTEGNRGMWVVIGFVKQNATKVETRKNLQYQPSIRRMARTESSSRPFKVSSHGRGGPPSAGHNTQRLRARERGPGGGGGGGADRPKGGRQVGVEGEQQVHVGAEAHGDVRQPLPRLRARARGI